MNVWRDGERNVPSDPLMRNMDRAILVLSDHRLFPTCLLPDSFNVYKPVEVRLREAIKHQLRYRNRRMSEDELNLNVERCWRERSQFVRDLETLEELRVHFGPFTPFERQQRGAREETPDSEDLPLEILIRYGELLARVHPVDASPQRDSNDAVLELKRNHPHFVDEVYLFATEPYNFHTTARATLTNSAQAGIQDDPTGVPSVFDWELGYQRLTRLIRCGSYPELTGRSWESLVVPSQNVRGRVGPESTMETGQDIDIPRPSRNSATSPAPAPPHGQQRSVGQYGTRHPSAHIQPATPSRRGGRQ